MLDDTVAAYLRRLSLTDVIRTVPSASALPSAAVLAEIHRAQVERVAYNTVDIQLRRPTPIAPSAAAQRFAATGRGGYCFQLNGALSWLLQRLGYTVTRHRGGVWRTEDEVPLRPRANHLALLVTDLPTADNPGGAWFVDGGLGDALHEPLPLVAGEYRQGPFTYRLSPSPVLAGGWRFEHDPTGSFTGMDFEACPAAPDAFDDSHTFLSTSPTSPFVGTLTVVRRDGTGVDRLIGAALLRNEGTRRFEWELRNEIEFAAALADVFGLTLDDVDAAERTALWTRARAATEEWKRTRAVAS